VLGITASLLSMLVVAKLKMHGAPVSAR